MLISITVNCYEMIEVGTVNKKCIQSIFYLYKNIRGEYNNLSEMVYIFIHHFIYTAYIAEDQNAELNKSVTG